MSFLPCRPGKDFPHALQEEMAWASRALGAVRFDDTIGASGHQKAGGQKAIIANWATGGSQKFEEADKRMRLGR